MPSFSLKSKDKDKSLALLPTWPPHHIKCSSQICQFPNPPQAAPGQYTCKASFYSGFFCEGVFRVSRSVADDVMRTHKEEMRRLDAAERSVQLKTALEEEWKRSEARKYRQQEEARRLAAAELAAIVGPKREHKVPEQTSKQLHLERRPAQRKRHGKDEVPPDSHSYEPRPTFMPRSDVPREAHRQPIARQGPRRAPTPVPIQYYPNPQPHIREFPLPPAPQSRAPPVRPPRCDLKYQYTDRF